MTLELFCTCGSVWTGDMSEPFAEQNRASWTLAHSGRGHERGEEETAAKAREREEKEKAKC